MKTRPIAIVITIIVISSLFVYLYDQMYDCLNPPMWMKHPRHYGLGDCLQMYYDRTLPDYTQARENHAREQAHRNEMVETFSNVPEVVAFYGKHGNDANVSVRNDHVSYFAGNVESSHPRMNLHYDEKNKLTHMRFYCFDDRGVQYEVSQEDILHYLENKDCMPKDSSNSTIDEYDTLLTRTVTVSSSVSPQKYSSKICHDISGKEFEKFPKPLIDVMSDAKSEILAYKESERYDLNPVVDDSFYLDGYGEIIKAKDALDFLQKYEFNLTKEETSKNIGKIPDTIYSFECDVLYNSIQHHIVFDFEPLYPSHENFVQVEITEDDFGMSKVSSPEITVYHTFNSTVIFKNNLNYDIVLSRQDGNIHSRGVDFKKVTIPDGQSWSYMLRTWNMNDESHIRSAPFNYVIQPDNLQGKILIKNYPHCMTQPEVLSLYSQVDAYPKIPLYLPEGYSFECGIHNMNGFVHMTYWTDQLRQKYDDQVGGSFQFEFFANGGMSIDYYDEYVLNGWPNSLDYDKYEKAKEKAEHPRATSLMILDEPAVMIQDAARVHGEIQSYNSLKMFLDDGVQYNIRTNLPQDELIKIAESIIHQESG